MKEIWKDIEGFEGVYQVSNLGRVKSLARTRRSKGGCICPVAEKILRQNTDKDGYKDVALSRDAKLHYLRVHRLVALAFIPNPHNYPMINHKDENPANNTVSNLEWCDQSYNTSYSNYKISRPVLLDGKYFVSIRAAARSINADGHALKYRLQKGGLFRGRHTVCYAITYPD